MRIGELRKRIEIQEAVAARDEYGGITPSWITVYRAWAKVEDLAGRELFQAQQLSSETNVRFTIRFRDGIDSKMRIRYRGALYDITSITDLEQRHWELILLAALRPDNRQT